jgi:hypothetical protein
LGLAFQEPMNSCIVLATFTVTIMGLIASGITEVTDCEIQAWLLLCKSGICSVLVEMILKTLTY